MYKLYYGLNYPPSFLYPWSFESRTLLIGRAPPNAANFFPARNPPPAEAVTKFQPVFPLTFVLFRA